MNYREQLHECRKTGRALLATNFYNFETLAGVIQAAKDCAAPIILQTSPSTLSYLGGASVAAAMARAVAGAQHVNAYLHLDHATEMDAVQDCIDAGYDSVMIDASECDYAENIRRTTDAIQRAHPANIAVEAELGYIPKLGQKDATGEAYTDPAQAADFVGKTGVGALAVAIGTAHGFYAKTPRLDLERLAAIGIAVDIPLVLHGGSGLREEVWREVIRRGIVKINFATEIKDTFVRALKSQLAASEDIDLRKLCPPAIAAVASLVSQKLRVCGWGVK